MKKYYLISLLALLFSGTGLKAQTVIFSKTNVTCNGASDGTITISLSGGTSSYRYVIYNAIITTEADTFGPTGDLSHTFTDLSPNLYSAYVIDLGTGNVLDFFSPLTITQPLVLNASVASANVNCFGGSTGSITISGPSGGSGSYEYSISGGSSWQISGTFTGLSANTYVVMMRDRNAPGCTRTLNGALVISQLPQLTATVNSTNVTCYNLGNGSITISSPSGGSGSYQFSRNGTTWQPGLTFSGLAPGTYTIQMRDATYTTCSVTLSTVTITQPSELKANDILILKGLTCNESTDGQLQAVVAGGTPPYSYTWYIYSGAVYVPIGQTGQTATGLGQGRYQVTVNDSRSCGPSNAVEYFLPGFTDSIPPVFYFDSASVITTCAGQSNGSIILYAHGGKTPYSYSITTGGASGYQSSNTFSNLAAGSYQTWAMDKKGCKKGGSSVNVGTTPNSPVSVSITANPSGSICPGTSVLFTATPVNGGTSPSYQWRLNGTSVGSGGPTYTNAALANGDQVNVILTSSLRCTTGNPSTSNTITASLLIPPSITTQPTSIAQCAGTNATFTVVATGTGLTYQWRKAGVNIAGATGTSYTITGITPASAGNYDVVITGTCGTVTSNTVTLTVNTAPAITTQPASIAQCAGTNATFTVVATGTGLTYQWRKAGVNIPGATGASYTITGITPANAGNYDVVITGTCGTVTSNTVTLTVNTAPVITTQPVSITQCAGTNATFTVVATGTGLTYQWRKAGVNIAGATGTSYTITGITPASAGNYDVVITGTCGTVTSNTVTLTVNTAPVITTQPTSLAQCAGTNATFTVVATGPGLSYQWRKAGVNIPGATGASYTITGITPASAGNYDVVITGTCGTVTSNTVTLTVNTAPVITTQPVSITQCAGTNATFTVVATGTGLTYQWRKAGVNIAGATGTSYTITGITPASAGNYDVVITGTCGTVTSNTVTLTVNTAPVITTQPTSLAQCAGTNATFTVVATGTGLTYQWRKAGVNIAGATGASYTITGITAANAGNYDVVITGTCGTATSNIATLTVYEAPLITTQPVASVTQCEGTNVTFTVVATGTGLTYQWRKAGVNIPGATGSSYTITGITPASAGNYDVVITGTCGSVTSITATLTVNTAPVITTQPVASVAQCEGTNVTFTVVAMGTGLTYQWRKAGVNIPGATGSSFTITGITTASAGNYDVVITGTCGTVTSNTAVLTVNTAPVITTQPASVTQCTGTDVTFTVIANGTGLTYQWRKNGLVIGGATNSTLTLSSITPSSAASYDVVITGTCGSVISNAAVLTVAENPAIVFHPSGIEVCEGADATFAVTATGTGITYQWRKNGTIMVGETSSSITLTSVTLSDAGQYDVIIYGLCDTITSNNATLTVDPATTASIIDNDTLVCVGSTVEFNVATAGYGSITYQWQWYYGGSWINLTDDVDISGTSTDALTISNIEIADTGYYRCVVTSGCGSANSESVRLDVNLITATIGTPAPFLINSATTSIQVGIKTSTHFLVHDLGFSLVAPDGTEVLLKSPQLDCIGPYLASVNVSFTTDPAYTDTIDYCSAVGNITGTYAATGDWSLLNGMDPSNGAWQVRIYDAENANGDSYDGYLTSATLVFTDLDNLGDTAVISYNSGVISEEILNPVSSEIRATSYIMPIRLMTTCWNSEDARAIVTVTGGITPFTYAWSGPTTVPNSNDVTLGRGTYTVTVTDAMGCSTQATVEVTSPPPIIYDSFLATDTLRCHGVADGIVRMKASGGTGSLTYTLLPNIPSSVADSGVFTGLNAGTYTLHVSDINDCSHDTTFTIHDREIFALQSVTVDSLSCSGDTDGSISVIAQGGRIPYTYWITPGTEVNNDGVFDNLSQDNYVIRVTDAGTCGDTLITDTIRMDAPSPLVIDSVTVDPIICNGGRGALTLHVSGGSQPYDGSVDGGSSFTPALSFSDLGPGNYTPAVRDDNACIVVYPSSFSLTDPPLITIDSLSTTAVTGCYGDATGSIYIAASGGWNTIEYSLDAINYQTDNHFNLITGGPKTIYIKDSLGCIVTIDTVVDQPPQLMVDVALTHAIGSTLGTITLTASGGTPPYVYSIDNGVNTQDAGDFGDLVPGLYDVFVQDSHGCIFTDTVRIIMNELEVEILQTDASCYGFSDGEFIITVQNGTPPYIMFGGFLDTDTITSTDGLFPFTRIAAGTYSFTIEDAEGRTYTRTIVISEFPQIIITGTITRPACTLHTNDGSVEIEVTGGDPDYSFSWSNGSTGQNLVNIPEGLYKVIIIDESLCTDSAEFDVVAYNSAIADAGPDDTVCSGVPYLLRGFDLGHDEVLWEPTGLVNDSAAQSTIASVYERTEFIYTVYNNSCWDKDTVVIDIFPLIGLDITSSVEVIDTAVYLLSGQEVTLEATDGFESYSWDPPTGLSSDTSRIVICTPVVTQKYYVTATTEFGCEETDSIYLVIAQAIQNIYTGFTPNGDGVNDKWVIPHALEYGDKIEVQVFNRWGQRLFYSRGYGGSNEWEGTFKGKPVPVGTYYYIITLDDGKTEPFTGTVTIIR